ncbi:MAG: CRISPR-associated protein [Phaeodactylibacter sp.]|uniref:CRISPR-associated protein n=1 Tax=Phaeodactylibacter sp. TaxID=1940289 RepID=UPI0032EEBAF5
MIVWLVLLNLSNHPCSSWPETQRQSATEQFGDIEDMPFPQIPPEADADDVRQIVEGYEGQIRKLAADDPSLTVHLMGELTFTHLLVNRLHTAGIPCVASTSERIVLQEANGKKTSQFKFVRFRGYAKT